MAEIRARKEGYHTYGSRMDSEAHVCVVSRKRDVHLLEKKTEQWEGVDVMVQPLHAQHCSIL
jgi:hypothetical protein